MRWDCTLGDTQLRSMQAQGLSHHLMRRSLSQEEGERGWYVYVCACVYVRAYVVNKYITIYVGTLCDLFCAYAMSFDSSICFYIILFHRDMYERVSVQMCAYVDVCVYIYIYIHIYIHVHVFTYIHIHTHKHMYITCAWTNRRWPSARRSSALECEKPKRNMMPRLSADGNVAKRRLRDETCHVSSYLL